MTDVRRCYGIIDEGNLDKESLVDLVMGSDSWAAVYMVLAWYSLLEGRTDRCETHLASAKASCRDDQELAYVLHVESMALARTGLIGPALEKESACLDACRRAKESFLATRVLAHLGAISHAIETDGMTGMRESIGREPDTKRTDLSGEPKPGKQFVQATEAGKTRKFQA